MLTDNKDQQQTAAASSPDNGQAAAGAPRIVSACSGMASGAVTRRRHNGGIWPAAGSPRG